MWLTTQEGRRGSDETFVLHHKDDAADASERAFWMLVEKRMRTTAENLSEARLYASEHPDEVARLADSIVGEPAFEPVTEPETGSVSDDGGKEDDGGVVPVPEDVDGEDDDFGFEIEDMSDDAVGAEPDPDDIAMWESEYAEENPDDPFLEVSERSTDELRDSRDRATGGRADFVKHYPKVRTSNADPTDAMKMIKGVPRHVYAAVEKELVDAGAFSSDTTYNQGDIVTVALAYLCDLSGDGLTDKQARALEAFRKNSKNAQFETARNMRRISHRLEDVMRTCTATLTLESYMARRNLGMSMSDTPATAADLDIVDDEGQDDFYESIMLQGTIQYERDAEQLGRDITSSRFGLKTI